MNYVGTLFYVFCLLNFEFKDLRSGKTFESELEKLGRKSLKSLIRASLLPVVQALYTVAVQLSAYWMCMYQLASTHNQNQKRTGCNYKTELSSCVHLYM